MQHVLENPSHTDSQVKLLFNTLLAILANLSHHLLILFAVWILLD